MRIDRIRTAALARRKGLSLTGLLKAASVSRNTFYHLARKPSILPDSIERIAHALDVDAADLLCATKTGARHARELWARVDAVERAFPGVNRDNVRHTLLLLEERPEERLRRALRRGRRPHLQ